LRGGSRGPSLAERRPVTGRIRCAGGTDGGACHSRQCLANRQFPFRPRRTRRLPCRRPWLADPDECGAAWLAEGPLASV